MQELLSDIEIQFPDVNRLLYQTFELKEFYLEKERQQIIDAHNDGGLDGDKMGTIYYNETLK